MKTHQFVLQYIDIPTLYLPVDGYDQGTANAKVWHSKRGVLKARAELSTPDAWRVMTLQEARMIETMEAL